MSLKQFQEGYVCCALWSSTDESTPSGGYPLDENHDARDIAPESLAKMNADCERFYNENEALLESADDSHAGHDFWLSRNGHGAGFFDGDEKQYGADYARVCELLQEAAEKFGGQYMYVGDDKRIYVS